MVEVLSYHPQSLQKSVAVIVGQSNEPVIQPLYIKLDGLSELGEYSILTDIVTSNDTQTLFTSLVTTATVASFEWISTQWTRHSIESGLDGLIIIQLNVNSMDSSVELLLGHYALFLYHIIRYHIVRTYFLYHWEFIFYIVMSNGTYKFFSQCYYSNSRVIRVNLDALDSSVDGIWIRWTHHSTECWHNGLVSRTIVFIPLLYHACTCIDAILAARAAVENALKPTRCSSVWVIGEGAIAARVQAVAERRNGSYNHVTILSVDNRLQDFDLFFHLANRLQHKLLHKFNGIYLKLRIALVER